MDYQWYPGHMTKARRMMEDNIKLIDLIIEIIDARIPYSSRNPDIRINQELFFSISLILQMKRAISNGLIIIKIKAFIVLRLMLKTV